MRIRTYELIRSRVNVETMAIVVIIGLCIVWSMHFERRRRAALLVYWSRTCAGRAWRDAFPDAPKDSIREFLYFVVDAFGFERDRALKLAPNDTVLGLYRACYPEQSVPDGLELETLHRTLSARYGADRFEALPDGTTFGELFRRVREARSNISLERARER